MGLTREAIAACAAKPLPIQKVDVPALGDDVYIREMSGLERDAWEVSLLKGRGVHQRIGTDNVRARLVVRCLVDQTGTRVLSDSEADIALLGSLPASVLGPLFDVAQRLNGIGEQDVNALKHDSEMAAGSGSPTN